VTLRRFPFLTSRIGAGIALLAVLAGTGCSSGGSTGSAHPGGDASPTAPTGIDATWAKLADEVDGRKPVSIDGRLPKAPEGFSRADVSHLAEYARSVVRKSYGPQLSRSSEKEAADYVLATLPDWTEEHVRSSISDLLGSGTPGTFVVADRFADPEAIDEPTVVYAKWTAEKDRSADGTPYLRVGLKVAVRTHVTEGDDVRPIVVSRTITASSTRPQDPTWNPGVGYDYAVYGADKCTLFRKGTLAPTASRDELKQALRLLPLAFGGKVKRSKDDPDGSTSRGVKDIFTEFC
jgi:hypothetical protein